MPPARRASRNRPSPNSSPRPKPEPKGRRAVVAGVVAVVVAVGLVGWLAKGRGRVDPAALIRRAEEAGRVGDWSGALDAWRALDEAGGATSETLVAEARAALAADRGFEAGRALGLATRLDPTDAGAWRARLDRLRLLDRPVEALALGREALRHVSAGDRKAILASITLAALADLPEDEARTRLRRWIAADPDDLDARAAWLARVAANPRPGDPDRASRIVALAEILGRDPGHVSAREALVVALADSGEVDRGRATLDGWPVDLRDARYDRLQGRWELEYDHRPDRAEASFRRALATLPHDWRSRYGLARALRALGREGEAKAEAKAVAGVRERLDPTALGPRLAGDLEMVRLGDTRGAADLAAVCDVAGLADLARAWSSTAR